MDTLETIREAHKEIDDEILDLLEPLTDTIIKFTEYNNELQRDIYDFLERDKDDPERIAAQKKAEGVLKVLRDLQKSLQSRHTKDDWLNEFRSQIEQMETNQDRFNALSRFWWEEARWGVNTVKCQALKELIDEVRDLIRQEEEQKQQAEEEQKLKVQEEAEKQTKAEKKRKAEFEEARRRDKEEYDEKMMKTQAKKRLWNIFRYTMLSLLGLFIWWVIPLIITHDRWEFFTINISYLFYVVLIVLLIYIIAITVAFLFEGSVSEVTCLFSILTLALCIAATYLHLLNYTIFAHFPIHSQTPIAHSDVLCYFFPCNQCPDPPEVVLKRLDAAIENLEEIYTSALAQQIITGDESEVLENMRVKIEEAKEVRSQIEMQQISLQFEQELNTYSERFEEEIKAIEQLRQQ